MIDNTHDSGDGDPLLISKQEAAYLLGVSQRTVDNLIARGKLPVRRIFGRVLIRAADLHQFVNAAA